MIPLPGTVGSASRTTLPVPVPLTITSFLSLSSTVTSTFLIATWLKLASALCELWLMAYTRSPSASESSTALTYTVCAAVLLKVRAR